MTVMFGLILIAGIPFLFVLAAAVLLRWFVRIWEGRDVLAELRPSRADVAATDRVLDDIHYGIVVEGNNYD